MNQKIPDTTSEGNSDEKSSTSHPLYPGTPETRSVTSSPNLAPLDMPFHHSELNQVPGGRSKLAAILCKPSRLLAMGFTPIVLLVAVYSTLDHPLLEVQILSIIIAVVSSFVVFVAGEVWNTQQQLLKANELVTRPHKVHETARRFASLEYLTADIRNNVTAMFSEIDKMSHLLDKQSTAHEHVQLMKHATDGLLLKSYDILEVAMLRKNSPGEFVAVDVRLELRTVVNSCNALAILKKISLVFYVSPRVPITFNTDQLRFRHAHVHMLNFCLNACDPGSIVTVEVDISPPHLMIQFIAPLKIHGDDFQTAVEESNIENAKLDVSLSHNALRAISGFAALESQRHGKRHIQFRFLMGTNEESQLKPQQLRDRTAVIFVDDFDSLLKSSLSTSGSGSVTTSHSELHRVARRVFDDHFMNIVEIDKEQDIDKWLQSGKQGVTSIIVITPGILTTPSGQRILTEHNFDMKIIIGAVFADGKPVVAPDASYIVLPYPFVYADLGYQLEQHLLTEERHYSTYSVTSNPVSFRSCDVLVIDSYFLSRRVIQSILDDLNQKTVAVGTVAEAAQEWAESFYPYVFVDLDLCMNVDLGEVLLNLDRDGDREVYIVALSSHSPQKTQMLCAQNPTVFSMFLCRPVQREDVTECLRTLFLGEEARSQSVCSSLGRSGSVFSAQIGGFLRALPLHVMESSSSDMLQGRASVSSF